MEALEERISELQGQLIESELDVVQVRLNKHSCSRPFRGRQFRRHNLCKGVNTGRAASACL